MRAIFKRAGRSLKRGLKYFLRHLEAVFLYPIKRLQEEGAYLSFWTGTGQRIRILAETMKKKRPCIDVVTEGIPVSSGEDYVPCRVNVFGCPEAYLLSEGAGIRVRGHSTAEQGEEKPYRIRFEKKESLLGLHDGAAFKSWVLLRTYHNLSPDYTAFMLYRAICGGKYYCSDAAFVNLYLNERPLGVYLLCEQNQAVRGRIQVHKPRKGESGREIGYLLELDQYAGEKHPFFTVEEKGPVTDIGGTERFLPARDYSVKSPLRSEEHLAYISSYLSGVYEVLYQASVNGRAMALDQDFRPVPGEDRFMNPFEAVCDVIDAESLCCMILLHELIQDYDVGMGGVFLAVDFSKESKYPRLTFLGPWDFNWSCGEDPDQGFYACTFQKIIKGDRSNGWYILAARMEGMQTLLREKWKSLRKEGLLEEALDRISSECEGLAQDLERQEFKLRGARLLTAFVERRIIFLDRQWL